MELNFILTQLLHQLGICKNYSGFDYIIFAIKRIDMTEITYATLQSHCILMLQKSLRQLVIA